MKRFVIALTIALLSLTSVAIGQTRRFNIDELMKVRRVGDAQLSPDGQHVAFTIGDVNFDANRTLTQIYVIPIGGGSLKQLTRGDSSASSPRWSPDGKKIAYVTGGQIWVMDDDGDDKEAVTKISTGAAGPVWSNDGRLHRIHVRRLSRMQQRRLQPSQGRSGGKRKSKSAGH